MSKEKLYQKYINIAILNYKNNYEYKGYVYKKKHNENRMYLLVKCKHQEKYIIAKGHIYKNSECNICKKDRKNYLRIQKFKDKSNLIHNNYYKYDRVINLKNLKDMIEIYCPKHKKYFKNMACNHLKGSGCNLCNNEKKRISQCYSKKIFINKANNVHNNFFRYNSIDYINSKTHINIECPIHGFFKQLPYVHLQGQKCPKCSNNKCSNMQIEWLKLKSIVDNTFIQHKMNKGEYLIDFKYNNNKKERLKPVDGYSEQLNKIYEFHGDFWHGNHMVVY